MTTSQVRFITIVESILFVLFAFLFLFVRADSMRDSFDRYYSRINYVYFADNDITLKEECTSIKGDRTFQPGSKCRMLYLRYNNPDNAHADVYWEESDGYKQFASISCTVDSFEEADQIREAMNQSYLKDQQTVRKELIITSLAILIYALISVGAAVFYFFWCIKHPKKQNKKTPDSHPVIYGILEGVAIVFLLVLVVPIVLSIIFGIISMISVRLQ